MNPKTGPSDIFHVEPAAQLADFNRTPDKMMVLIRPDQNGDNEGNNSEQQKIAPGYPIGHLAVFQGKYQQGHGRHHDAEILTFRPEYLHLWVCAGVSQCITNRPFRNAQHEPDERSRTLDVTTAKRSKYHGQ